VSLSFVRARKSLDSRGVYRRESGDGNDEG